MAVQYKDYYQVLGVAKGTSQDDIRKSFRKLARQHHPDVAKDKAAAEAKFKEINEAYEVLGDPEKRKQYDELGADWERRSAARAARGRAGGGMPGGMEYGGSPFGGGSFGGTGFSDFFEQFFAGSASRGGARRAGGPAGAGGFGFEEMGRGSDIEADLLVTLEEALHGARKKISFRRDDNARVETFEVKIPKGVREGQRIRLAGQGGAGGRPGTEGDLFLRVRFAQHPDYRIEGADLIHELELPAWDLVLGTEVNVPTPDGSVRLKIPAGTQPGRKFRVKGRGAPSGPEARGDFFIQVGISIPETTSDDERRHWEALRDAAK